MIILNIEEKVALKLLSNSLLNRSETIDEQFDFNSLRILLNFQCISSLVSTELANYVENAEQRNYCKETMMQCVSRSIRFIVEQDKLNSIFESRGLQVVVLKGISAARFYTNPLLRECGDIDYITPKEQFDQVVEVLLEEGYIQEHSLDTNECHITFNKGVISIELHKQWVSESMSKVSQRLNSFVFDGFDNLEKVAVMTNKNFLCFDALHNGIIILQHANRHMMQGIGLRQVADWMMFVKENLDNNFWVSTFSNYTDEFGLTKFAVTLTRMCQLFLGLPENGYEWCRSADESKCLELLNYIMNSGNMGKKASESNRGKIAVILRPRNIAKQFKLLQSKGRKHWKACERHPILIPFAWIYQLLSFLTKGIKGADGITGLVSDVGYATHENALVKELKGY